MYIPIDSNKNAHISFRFFFSRFCSVEYAGILRIRNKEVQYVSSYQHLKKPKTIQQYVCQRLIRIIFIGRKRRKKKV